MENFAFVDILQRRHAKMLLEQANEILGRQIAVGAKVGGGDLFVVVIAHVGEGAAKGGGQTLFFVGEGILGNGRGGR